MLKSIVVWVLTIPTAALLLTAALGNLTGSDESLASFGEDAAVIRAFVGSCELVGAVALFVPRLAFWGAVVLSLVMLGLFPVYFAEGPGLVVLSLLLGAAAIIGGLRFPQALGAFVR